ncbi:MAG: VPLPA-CTERM sorting domain-containing protein [Pseudomonadota bacterium]
MKNWTWAAALAVTTIGLAPANASTVPIVGGETEITVTTSLDFLDVALVPTGTATVEEVDSLPVFTFPITGGVAVDPADALIEHEGSGVGLNSPTVTATIGDFFIDTISQNVLGVVNGGSETVELFTFGDTTSDDGIELLISPMLAGVLVGVFAAPDLTGNQFGFATTAPEVVVAPVPLPATGVLLVAGLGALGFVARRRQRAG